MDDIVKNLKSFRVPLIVDGAMLAAGIYWVTTVNTNLALLADAVSKLQATVSQSQTDGINGRITSVDRLARLETRVSDIEDKVDLLIQWERENRGK